MNIGEWLTIGEELGFCGPLVCIQHDGVFTPEEADAFERGEDPCLHAVRILERRSFVESVLVD